MTNEELLNKIAVLPTDSRRRIERYVEYLQKQKSEPKKKTLKPLREEKFFGMWKDREDMRDSVGWVRNIRRTQWER